jgi:hypothetical protein
MDARSQLKKLGDLFMKNLDNDKLLELVVPRVSQLDLVGSIEIEAEDYDGTESLVRKTLGSRDTSKSYAQLMAIAGLVAEQLHCMSSKINFFHADYANLSWILCLNKLKIIVT